MFNIKKSFWISSWNSSRYYGKRFGILCNILDFYLASICHFSSILSDLVYLWPTENALIQSLQVRSSVWVRRGTLRSSTCSWGPSTPNLTAFPINSSNSLLIPLIPYENSMSFPLIYIPYNDAINSILIPWLLHINSMNFPMKIPWVFLFFHTLHSFHEFPINSIHFEAINITWTLSRRMQHFLLIPFIAFNTQSAHRRLSQDSY